MIAGVADTHTALWHLFGDARLSRAASDFINQTAVSRNKIAVSSISLAEVVYLVDKNRLPLAAYEDLVSALADAEHVLTEAALTAEIVQCMWRVPRAQVPDMPDRIVASTGIYFNVPVLSRDGCIRAAHLKTIW